MVKYVQNRNLTSWKHYFFIRFQNITCKHAWFSLESISTCVESISTCVESISTCVESISTCVESISTCVESISTCVESISTCVESFKIKQYWYWYSMPFNLHFNTLCIIYGTIISLLLLLLLSLFFLIFFFFWGPQSVFYYNIIILLSNGIFRHHFECPSKYGGFLNIQDVKGHSSKIMPFKLC